MLLYAAALGYALVVWAPDLLDRYERVAERHPRLAYAYAAAVIAGGVLLALLLIVAPKTFIDLARQGHGPVTGGYTIPVSTDAAGGGDAGGGGAAAAAFDPNQVIALLPAANPENGAGTFKKCLACHSAEKGAASKAGPNLWGVVGRARASEPGFNYSSAMKAKGGTWTFDELNKFLTNPRSDIPGTAMTFAGISRDRERADVIAYLRTLSDNPVPLPKVAEAPANAKSTNQPPASDAH